MYLRLSDFILQTFKLVSHPSYHVHLMGTSGLSFLPHVHKSVCLLDNIT